MTLKSFFCVSLFGDFSCLYMALGVMESLAQADFIGALISFFQGHRKWR